MKFFPVEAEWGPSAYNVHAEFTASNSAVLPRTKTEFLELVRDGFVWAAMDQEGHATGLAYSRFDPGKQEWETGGLMVLGPARGKGIGAILMTLALGAALVAEDPLAQEPKPIILAHVLKRNPLPRGIITEVLRYHLAHEGMKISPSAVPGLPVEEDGFVHGDEFHITLPDTLIALAEFCENWTGHLRTGEEAEVQLPEDQDLELWAKIFREMASRSEIPSLS